MKIQNGMEITISSIHKARRVPR